MTADLQTSRMTVTAPEVMTPMLKREEFLRWSAMIPTEDRFRRFAGRNRPTVDLTGANG